MRTTRALALVALLVLTATSAVAQPKSGAADLSVTAGKLAATPAVGDVFDVVYTVANAGPGDAPEAGLQSYVPPELELQAIASSDPADTCGPEQPAEDPPPPPEGKPAVDGGGSFGGGGVTCALGTMTAGSSVTVTATYRRIAARSSYLSAWAGSYADDPAYENNGTDVYLDADRSHPADVAVTIQAPKTADVGGTVEVVAVVSNRGPSRTESSHLSLPGAYGLDLRSATPSRAVDTCAAHEDGTVECRLGPLDPGESARVTFVSTRSSAYEVWGSAWVQGSGYDEVYDNDYASFSLAADPSVVSDLFVTMDGPAGTPLVGERFDFTIEAGNRGPSAAGDVWLSDYLPPGVELVSINSGAACGDDHSRYPMSDAPAFAEPGAKGDAYYPISGGGVFCDLGVVSPGETETVTITVERTGAREIWNSAWLSSSNVDPSYEDNYDDVLVEPDKSNPADVSLKLTAPERPEVGAAFEVTMTAANAGPSPAASVTATMSLPHGSEVTGVTPGTCTYSGDEGPPPADAARPAIYRLHEVTCDFGTLPAGESASSTVTLERTSEYEMWTSAWVATSSYDTDYENDYASALIAGKQYAGDCSGRQTIEGTDGGDTIVAGDCAVEAKAGADAVEMIPSSGGGDARVSTGRGGDTIDLNLSVGGDVRRSIHIDSGPGADVITLTVAAGAGNADVLVDAGSGADSIHVDAPAGVRGLRIVVLGRAGNDSILWSDARTPDSTYGVPRLVVRGGEGNDLAEGGYAGDKLHGGAGRDQLYGNLGDDYLRGGAGADVCRGGPGRDRRRSC